MVKYCGKVTYMSQHPLQLKILVGLLQWYS